MADDVAQQEEGITSLHLRFFEKSGELLSALVASLALIWLFLTMTEFWFLSSRLCCKWLLVPRSGPYLDLR
ncbi:MAG: hypothetical protein Ct9H90mP16_10770 [Candidatus Poseidoniales archaeon]|nr:MAG: hypothetical protein Ct9H90mP16_10770 [Candidatus Poseidoniales archaeon]